MRSQRAKVARNGKKAVGEGRVVLGQEPILAPIVNIDIFDGKMETIAFESIFFTICAFYID